MADDIRRHIEELVAEEHRLLDAAAERALGDDERRRMAEVDVELDRYYDLLRQRRARAEFGQDESAASLRAEGTVEHYLQ
ncbi:MAG: DUF2630 family protein [Vulcanimicrobiaceae bacterium]